MSIWEKKYESSVRKGASTILDEGKKCNLIKDYGNNLLPRGCRTANCPAAFIFFLKNRTIPLTNSTPPSPWSSPPARGGFVTTHDSRVTTRSPVTTTATLLLYSQTGPLFVTLGKRSRKVPAFRVLLLLSPPRLRSPRHQISRQRSLGTPFFPLCFLCLLLPAAGDFPEVCLGGR